MVVRVQTEDFDIGGEIAALTAGRTDVGGIGCFVGTVRADPRGPLGQVTGMTLEHYPGMTERAIHRIVTDAAARWPLLGVTVIHRVGPLYPGDNIVLVVTASSHRQAALDATSFLIDWLKTRAPFWKREDLTSGAGAWVDAREDDDAAAAKWDRTPPDALAVRP
jgi:molybdopterin synthase catalytic subunit